MIFLAHGIAAWLVRCLLAEAAGKVPGFHEDKILTTDQVAGIIFFKDFSHSRNDGFSYTGYIKHWFLTLSKLKTLRDEQFGTQDTDKDGWMRIEDPDEEEERLTGLKQRLRWIDDLFQGLSANQHLSRRTWVLDLPLSIDNMQQTSNLLEPAVANETPPVFEKTFRLRRRDSISRTKATRLARVNAKVDKIDACIQIVSSDNLTGPESDQRSVASSVVLVSRGVTGSRSHLYFPQPSEKLDHSPNRPRVPHQRSSSEPQAGGNRLLSASYTTTEPGKSVQRPHSYPPSKPPATKLSKDDEWKIVCERAQEYLLQGDLDNADVLCKWCVDIGSQRFKRMAGDIPLQWRMRRAIIQILKGQYQGAETQLQGILDSCSRLMEKSRTANKVWIQNPEKTDDAGYVPQDHLPTENQGQTSRVSTRSYNRGETILSSLSVLSLELRYNISVALTEMGRLQEAEYQVKLLQKHLEQWGSTCFPTQDLSAAEMRQFTLSVEVNRLMALLKGYQGSFPKAMKLISEAEEGERRMHEVETINYGPKFLTTLTKAKVLLSCGMAQDALQLVTKALPDMEKRIGRFRITSLETRCLKALLLSRASRTQEAETLCSETSDLINRHLGEHHPLLLDITYVLVSICEIQARPLQALRTSENLCTRAEETLGAKDQRTIRFKAQNAWIHVWIGNYEKGRLLLHEAHNSAESLWGENHPSTIECIPKLAFTYSLLGHPYLSTHYFKIALRTQMANFGLAKDRDPVLNEELPALIQEALSRIRSLNTNAAASDHEHTSIDSRRRSVHPGVLLTLELWAEAEARKTSDYTDLVLDARRVVFDVRRASTSFGETHVLTLRAGLSLAKSMRDNSDIDPGPIEELYDELWRNAKEALDLEHPLALSARQGLQTVQLVREKSPLKSPLSIANFFTSVQKAMSFRLGKSHPDVLRFSLDTFTLLAVVDSKGAEEVTEAFLEHVRSKTVWEQRAVESAKLQEQLAGAYFTQGKPGSALRILQYLNTQLRESEPKPKDDDPLGKLRMKISRAEEIVRRATEDYSNGVQTEEGL